jgi:hypothetical protein
MKKFARIAVLVAATLGLAITPAAAMGPVDGEISILYWLSETELDDGGSTVTEDSDDIGFRGELWFVKKFGASVGLFSADLADSNETVDYNNLDVKWRLLSPTENNFLAVGAGWQEIDTDGGDADGFRLVVEGRVAIVGILYFYGRGAHAPSLDADGIDGDMTELEAGVMLKPAPFLQLFAGYRSNDVSFDGGFDWTTDGFVAGAGINF